MSGARTVTVYDIQQKHPWVEEEAPGDDMREKDGGCHPVRWHTSSTLESAAVNMHTRDRDRSALLLWKRVMEQ